MIVRIFPHSCAVFFQRSFFLDLALESLNMPHVPCICSAGFQSIRNHHINAKPRFGARCVVDPDGTIRSVCSMLSGSSCLSQEWLRSRRPCSRCRVGSSTGTDLRRCLHSRDFISKGEGEVAQQGEWIPEIALCL